MFYLAHRGFNRRTKIAPFLLVNQTPLPPLGHIDLVLRKTQVKASIPFSSLSWTFLYERTILTVLVIKVCHKTFFLAAGMNFHRLFLRACNLGWLSILALFDFKIRQVEFLAAWDSSTNRGLNLFYFLLL
jgi:hypothetical protein